MKINQAGIDLIKRFEGLRLKAYQDMVGVWTIGYGHTGSDVTQGMTITLQQANDLLLQDLAKFETGVTDLVKSKIDENQFSALVSFAYNLGLGALKTSTLLRVINDNPNSLAVGDQMIRWDKAGGKQVPGLLARRYAEKALYFTPMGKF